jgi:hypothetical protein
MVVKHDAEGNPTKLKARLVAKGYSQEYGIHYEETYAAVPLAAYSTMRFLILLALQWRWTVWQYDVPILIYMHQPEGFEIYGPNGELPHPRLGTAILGPRSTSDGAYARCLLRVRKSILYNSSDAKVGHISARD